MDRGDGHTAVRVYLLPRSLKMVSRANLGVCAFDTVTHTNFNTEMHTGWGDRLDGSVGCGVDTDVSLTLLCAACIRLLGLR